jgi:succinoglycan biosynthesis protein ExoV
VYCVRGPRSARALGLAPDLAVTDGAVLVRTLKHPGPAPALAAAYMPHWRSDYHGDWRRVCQAAGLHFIDPAGSVETILDDIQRSRLLITEALHGAIVADALRVPWVPVKAYRHVLAFKWQDWCESVGLRYKPAPLPGLYQGPGVQEKLHTLLRGRLPAALTRLVGRTGQSLARPIDRLRLTQAVRQLQRLARHAQPQLSTDATMERVTARLLEQLEYLKQDFAAGRLKPIQN